MSLKDVSRLQIEKKEAEAAGKSFFEQYKELKKSSQANESALLVEMEQDLSVAQLDCKQSKETAADLEKQVAKLQAELQQQTSVANEDSEASQEQQQVLSTLQSELCTSQDKVNDLQSQLELKENELSDVQKVVDALNKNMNEGQSASEEVWHDAMKCESWMKIAAFMSLCGEYVHFRFQRRWLKRKSYYGLLTMKWPS